MAEEKLKWEHPVPGLDVLTDAGERVIAKVHRDEATRLWRPSIVGDMTTAPEFTSNLGAMMWVKEKMDKQWGYPPIEEETK